MKPVSDVFSDKFDVRDECLKNYNDALKKVNDDKNKKLSRSPNIKSNISKYGESIHFVEKQDKKNNFTNTGGVFIRVKEDISCRRQELGRQRK